MTLAEQYQREYARERGIVISANERARATILDLYRQVLAEAEFHCIGQSVLDDLWQQAIDEDIADTEDDEA